jgi:hypothetical protein
MRISRNLNTKDIIKDKGTKAKEMEEACTWKVK